MRGTIESYSIDDVEVRIAFDTDGAVGAMHVVEVQGNGWEVTRWFYFNEFEEDSVKSFVTNLVEDASFREASRERTADWAVVSDLYEGVASAIQDVYDSHASMSYRPGTEEPNIRARSMYSALEGQCELVFNAISDSVNRNIQLQIDEEEFATISELQEYAISEAERIASSETP